MKNNFSKTLRTYATIVIASFIAGVAVNRFLVPAGIMSGGITGISQIIIFLLPDSVNLSLGTIILLINTPLLILAWFKLSRKFAIRTAVATVLTSLFINIIPVATDVDLILGVIFSGVLSGFSVALLFSRGGSSGGVDIIAGIVRKKNPNVSVGTIYNMVNIGVYLVSGFLFGWTIVLYSLISAFVASLAIDKFFLNAQRVTALIVSNKGDEVASAINEELIRGVTLIDAKGSYTKEHKDMLMVTVSRDEINSLRHIIKKIDERAFITLLQSTSVYGNFEQKEL